LLAVDTWLGDAHATYYKESSISMANYHRRYESFPLLRHGTFDQALQHIPNALWIWLQIDRDAFL